MTKQTVTLIVFLFFVFSANAQEPKKKVEAFFNVSNALAKATGNTDQEDLIKEPYLIGLKIANNKDGAFRLGGNFDIGARSEIFNNFIRTTAETGYAVNIGWEHRRPLINKFTYYYGIDARYYSFSSITTSIGTGTDDEIGSLQNGPGAGPFLGFVWNINPRMSLWTEANISFDVVNTYRYLIDVNGTKTELENAISYRVTPIAPGSVFFSIKL